MPTKTDPNKPTSPLTPPSTQEIPMATAVVPENSNSPSSFPYSAYANTSSGGSQFPPVAVFGEMCISQDDLVIENNGSPITNEPEDNQLQIRQGAGFFGVNKKGDLIFTASRSEYDAMQDENKHTELTGSNGPK